MKTIDFGEMLLWAGFFVIASGSLQTNLVQMGCALLSPLFVCFLLLKISGIPLLESAADKKWGDDASYKQYKANTSVLIPFVGRK